MSKTNYILILTVGIQEDTKFLILDIDTYNIQLISRRELISLGLNPNIKLHNLSVFSDTNSFVLNSIVPRITAFIKYKDLNINKYANLNKELTIKINFEFDYYNYMQLQNIIDITEIIDYEESEEVVKENGDNLDDNKTNELVTINSNEVHIFYNLNKKTNKLIHLTEKLSINKINEFNREIIININQKEELQDFELMHRNSVDSRYITRTYIKE